MSRLTLQLQEQSVCPQEGGSHEALSSGASQVQLQTPCLRRRHPLGIGHARHAEAALTVHLVSKIVHQGLALSRLYGPVSTLDDSMR